MSYSSVLLVIDLGPIWTMNGESFQGGLHASARAYVSMTMFRAIMFHIGIATQHPPLPEKGQLSELGIDFVEKCLDIDPMKRPTASELMEHEWIVQFSQEIAREMNNHDNRAQTLNAEEVEGIFDDGQYMPESGLEVVEEEPLAEEQTMEEQAYDDSETPYYQEDEQQDQQQFDLGQEGGQDVQESYSEVQESEQTSHFTPSNEAHQAEPVQEAIEESVSATKESVPVIEEQQQQHIENGQN